LCNLAQVDWDDLRYVLAVTRHRTLSRAASDLGATHTTVGRRLRTIESALGVRLFDQTSEGFALTPAGQEVFEVAERMESELMSLEARVLGQDSRLQGKIRVTTMDILFRRYQAALSSFLDRYPSVDLTLTTSDTEASLLRRDADVALRMTNTPPEYLVGRKIGRVDFAAYASRSLVERVGQDAPYAAFPWLHWDERLRMSWFDGWLAQNAPGARIVMRVDVSSVVLRHVIAAGIGAHFLACFEGDQDPELRRIGPIESSYSRDVWLLTLPELRNTSRIRAFLDHVAESTTQ
jgi:DNA-binding transcriptional LysR family regulator